MQVYRSIDALPRFHNAVITIGTFDGVHLGHQKIIAELVQQAVHAGGESILVTFEPHPRKIVSPSQSLQLINTLQEKIELLSAKGLDHLVIVPFTTNFAEQNPEAYIHDFLIARFHPHVIIIGYDHHFGKDRKGNFRLLQEKSSVYNYTLVEIPKHVLNEIDISSTKIRNALLQSQVEAANSLLGYSFFFEGLVVQGDKIGRELGYPTANLLYTDADKIRLGEGVFAVWCHVNGQRKKGMLSIGKRPTLNDIEERVELNVFDFDGDLYGSTLRVMVEYFLRPQQRYNTLEELKHQIGKDKEATLQKL
jgi:riboflavin kinase/FMN adenylyltransferase